MPTPVTVVASGGVSIVNTPLGTPMTPVSASVGALPMTVVADVASMGGIPISLVKEDLIPWP